MRKELMVSRHRNRFAEQRKARGLSQEALARAVGVDTSTAARWERGENEPQPLYRQRLADALAVSVEEVGALLAGNDGLAAALDEQAVTDIGKSPPDLTTVAGLRQQVHALDAQYVATPPTSLLGEANACLSQAVDLRAVTYSSRVRRELLALEAEAGILVGQLVWDASQRRDHATTRACLSRAVWAARECRDPVTEGWALLRTTMVALYGTHDPNTGVTLAQQTAETAHSSNALTGLALLHAAEAYAMRQQTRECHQALAQAEDRFARMGAYEPAAELVSPGDLGRMAGSCHLSLGDAARAEAALAPAADEIHGPSKLQAVVLGNLGLAQLRQRKIEEASATLHRSLDVVGQTGAGGGVTVVFRAGRELRQWQEVTAAREVCDRMWELVAA